MKIIECPRDAMQGLERFVPTEIKINYINQLLKVGFDTIDFGSFVSPKAIPQMKDTAKVLDGLLIADSSSKLLAIVANLRGAQEAADVDGIDYLGFPLSVSETFQLRNTNQSVEKAFNTLDGIQNICVNNNMSLVTYLSMGFGNPYGDPYSEDLISVFVERLVNHGLEIISLADTIGASTPNSIESLFTTLIPGFPSLEFGAHLHSHPSGVQEKIAAAYRSGCRRFDGALQGYGGCPMAEDQLVGNIPTESIISCLEGLGAGPVYDKEALNKAMEMVNSVFST